MGEWFEKRMDEIAEFNPRESIPKGTIAKKVAMDKLQPFCRDIPEFEMEPFSGGTKFRNGDTIMARITPCLENGKTAKVDVLDDDEVGFGSTEYIVFRAKEGNDPDFIYYLVTSPVVRDPAIKSMVGSSGRQRVQTDVVQGVKVSVPDLEGQQTIAGILKTLDDKIAANRRVNDNLLQQVTACFHHHFNAYEASTDAIGSLGDVAQFKYGTMPKKDKLGSGEYVAFSGYQVVGSYPEKMFSTPQLIVVARGVGGCGDIKYTPSNCYLTNLSIAILSQNTAIEDYLFNYLRLHDTTVMNTGSAQPQITVSTLEKYQLPIPPEDLLASFSTFVQPFKTLYRKNKAEIERLQVLRDTLLPRLMSGELDVSNIDL